MRSKKEKIAFVIVILLAIAAVLFGALSGIDRGDLLFEPEYGLFGIPWILVILVVTIVIRIVIERKK